MRSNVACTIVFGVVTVTFAAGVVGSAVWSDASANVPTPATQRPATINVLQHPLGRDHIRYKLIDIGTFGGPDSYSQSPGNSYPALNGNGTVVGSSATSLGMLPKSNPFICGGTHGGVPYIFHAFELQGDAVSDLGALGTTYENCSLATSVNAMNEIAGVSEIDTIDSASGLKELRAVAWRAGKIRDLGTFGGNHSFATGINDKGQIIGAALNAKADPFSIIDLLLFSSSFGTQTRAFLFDHGVMQDLGTLGGPDAAAAYINRRGQIAGFSYTNYVPNSTTGLPTTHPFIWENGYMKDLGTLGGTFAYAGDFAAPLNNRGQLVGESYLSGDVTVHPFLWNGHKLIDLYTRASGGKPLGAAQISDSGEIVGGAAFSKKHERLNPFIMRDFVVTDLGLPAGDCLGNAIAINSMRQVVGNAYPCNGNFRDAFLWDDGTMYNLNDLIPPSSALHLVTGFSINDRGEIAGWGVPSGVNPKDVFFKGHAYLLIPCDDLHASCDDTQRR